MSTEPKFPQPAPWTVDRYEPYVHIRDADGFFVAREVYAQTAPLITSAPDLLRALIRAHNCINELTEVLPIDQWPDNPVGPTGVLRQCFDAICRTTSGNLAEAALVLDAMAGQRRRSSAAESLGAAVDVAIARHRERYPESAVSQVNVARSFDGLRYEVEVCAENTMHYEVDRS